MSDIRLEFSPWVGVAMFGAVYWPVLAPLGLGMAAVGGFGRALPRAVRCAAWGGAGLCAAPFVLLLGLWAADGVGRARQAAEGRAPHRTLSRAETVQALRPPAGA
jgi:hypothetical protein